MVVLRVARSVTVESRRDKVTFYIDTSKEILPDGPYAMNSSFGNLFAVCRLFEDEYCAFIGGSVQRQSPTSFGWSLSGVSVRHFALVDAKLTFKTGAYCGSLEAVLQANCRETIGRRM